MVFILVVGFIAGVCVVFILDHATDNDRVARAGRGIPVLISRLQAARQEHKELKRKVNVAENAIQELKHSLAGHLTEVATIESAFSQVNFPLQSTRRVDAESAIVYGRGSEWVYLYTFATHEDLATARRKRHFPMKLGMSTQEDVVKRVDQQVSGNSTAMAERAVLRLVFRVNCSSQMESWMHKKLESMGRKVSESVGEEWYETNPSEVEQLFRSFVLRYHRLGKPVATEPKLP